MKVLNLQIYIIFSLGLFGLTTCTPPIETEVEIPIDFSTLESAALLDSLFSSNRSTQILAAKELFKREHIEGIAIARDSLIWPRIRKLTFSDGNAYAWNSSYQYLKSMGHIAVQPFIENLHNPQAHTDTRKWCARLLGEVGRFAEVFDILLAVLHDEPPIYAWWHKAEASNGLRVLFKRQPLSQILPYSTFYSAAIRRITADALKEKYKQKKEDEIMLTFMKMIYEDEKEDIRKKIAYILGDVGDTYILPILYDVKETDTSEEVRLEAEKSIYKIIKRYIEN